MLTESTGGLARATMTSPLGDSPAPLEIREAWLLSNGARLYVRDVGHGLPIVVLHGGPDFNHEYLLPELDGLADQFRFVDYDQRGRARSLIGAPSVPEGSHAAACRGLMADC